MKRLLVALAASSALAICTAPAIAGSKSGGGAKSSGSKSSKSDYRSAKTGQYVTKSHAEKSKDTTVKESRKP